MKNRIKRKTQKPMQAILLCAALLIVSIFLPYMTAEEEYKEFLIAAEQDTSLSLLDFAQVYLEQDENSLMIIVAIMAGLAVLAALMAVCRKPLGVLLFGVLDTAWAVLNYMMFSSGLGYGYQLAIAPILIFVACGGMVIGAIWMLMVKSKIKKAARKVERKRMAADDSNSQ